MLDWIFLVLTGTRSRCKDLQGIGMRVFVAEMELGSGWRKRAALQLLAKKKSIDTENSKMGQREFIKERLKGKEKMRFPTEFMISFSSWSSLSRIWMAGLGEWKREAGRTLATHESHQL